MRSLQRPLAAALALFAILGAPALRARADTASSADYTELSLEDLLRIEVTTASKKAEALGDTTSAVYVITADDIWRSGFTTLPEVLRLVPGMDVSRVTSNTWALSARGFDGQFANKLLVLMDGRSLYTPTFAGVFWDDHDVPLDDIERIEVVRGPGGTICTRTTRRSGTPSTCRSSTASRSRSATTSCGAAATA